MRVRLFLSFLLIVLVSVLTVVIVARQNTTSAVRAFMYRGGMVGEETLVDSLVSYYQTNQTWQGVESLLAPGGRGQGHGMGAGGMMQGTTNMMGQRLRVADVSGLVVADSTGSEPSGTLSTEEKKNAVPIQVDGKTVGFLYAEGGMGFSQRGERELISRITNAAITAGLVAIGFSLLLAIGLAYSLMKPVRQLTKAAKNLGEGDLSQRVKTRGHDELAILANAFNRMADSLQQSEESRRSMTADIAHELRNPLAVQRANLEALQDGIYPLTPEALEPVHNQNLLLTRLVDDLRMLALADSGQLSLEFHATDLAEVIHQLVERHRPQAGQNRIDLTFHITPGTTVPLTARVDPLRLDQILNNLLSNSLRHTPEGGRIEVALRQMEDRAVITVHDNGPGITPEALPHIFERFYRADHSRSRQEGGTGLGLAIARHLAQAHGGTLTAGNHPQGGAVFTLQMPLKNT